MDEPVTTSTAAESGAWKDVALLLLGSAAEHAVHCGDGGVEPFRKHVQSSLEGLRSVTGSAQILMNAGGVSQAITHFSQQTQRQVDALLTDISDTAALFLQHMESLHGDADSQTALLTLRSTVEDALRESQLGDAQESIRQQLKQLAEQATVRRVRSLELSNNLQDRITVLEKSSVRSAPLVASSMDSCTGLPKRVDAEAALAQAIAQPPNDSQLLYAAAFYVHRMALTNARFGEAIGNQVVLFCSQQIASTVTGANDLLFRWSGPAFVAILERPDSPLVVSGEIQRMISVPLSRFFETTSRSVYLPVKITGEVIPLFGTNYPEVCDKLENFLLKTSGQAAMV
jgi:GGDEF domain-containing protein